MQHKFKCLLADTSPASTSYSSTKFVPTTKTFKDIIAETYHGTSTGILYEAQFLINNASAHMHFV